jgi:hypothetical protein
MALCLVVSLAILLGTKACAVQTQLDVQRRSTKLSCLRDSTHRQPFVVRDHDDQPRNWQPQLPFWTVALANRFKLSLLASCRLLT